MLSKRQIKFQETSTWNEGGLQWNIKKSKINRAEREQARTADLLETKKIDEN